MKVQLRSTCQVIAFPAAKRRGRIRHIANVLASKHGRAADAYWRRSIATMAGQMEKAGIPQAEIEAELRAFFDAVQSELILLVHADKNSGGAA